MLAGAVTVVEHDLGLAVAVGVEPAADVREQSHCVEYCSVSSTTSSHTTSVKPGVSSSTG